MALNRGVESAWWALRISLGSVAFLAGLDNTYFRLPHGLERIRESVLRKGSCRSPFLSFWGWSA